MNSRLSILSNWIRVPFSLSWIFQDSFLPELHTEITAFATKLGSSIFARHLYITRPGFGNVGVNNVPL